MTDRNKKLSDSLSHHQALKQQPLISVVIPSFNHAAFIKQAILSVFCQSYKNFELVVVDDGSTDGTPDLLSELQLEYPFKFIAQENQGVCRTLNRGIIELSKGDYIGLLGSDDLWHEEKLELQLQQLKRNPASEFCFGQALRFKELQQSTIGSAFPRQCHTGNVLGKVFLRQHVPAGTIIFSRGLFDKVDGFDETLAEEDWDFVIRCAAETEFCAVNAPLLYYRQHDRNTMVTRGRSRIFQDKARLLSKNFHLANPWIWMLSLFAHFLFDHVISRFDRRKK